MVPWWWRGVRKEKRAGEGKDDSRETKREQSLSEEVTIAAWRWYTSSSGALVVIPYFLVIFYVHHQSFATTRAGAGNNLSLRRL